MLMDFYFWEDGVDTLPLFLLLSAAKNSGCYIYNMHKKTLKGAKKKTDHLGIL